ncbi:MAG: hypothetical protein U1E10_06380, partial [Bdellovibrionales bacterium]|nr:hypothetical protein [Bdellovibrionales bacterium]
MGSNHSSRRDFLKLFGKATAIPLFQSPVQILIESIVLGASQSAVAETMGLSPRRLLHILHEGAPPRWAFDLFLTPYSSAGFVANKTVGTRFAADGKSIEYATIQRKGINVPHIWQYSVPRAGGGLRPMEDLLNNMLCLRGINVANPAHGGAQAAQSVPVGATQSISALSGDPSSMPIPAVNAGFEEFNYLSNAAKAPVTVPSSGNMIETLLNPFLRKDLGEFNTKRVSLSAALDSSVKALNMAAESSNKNSAVISNSLTSAKDLLSKGFGDLDQSWNDLVAKYTDLIQRSLDPAVEYSGINTVPIISDGSSIYRNNTVDAIAGFDLRQMISTKTNCSLMAMRFAMAEYVLIQNLSSSISISSGSLSSMSFNDDKNVRHKFDEHQTGAMSSMIQNAYWNVAYSACLLELIDQLKAKNIFQETVILTGSEFGRNPKFDGSG